MDKVQAEVSMMVSSVCLCKLTSLLLVGGLTLRQTEEASQWVALASGQMKSLLADLVLLTVPVVDAFALSDHIINSPLGRYDGEVYEAYFNQVRLHMQSSEL
jgi:acyl-CoA oxidase